MRLTILGGFLGASKSTWLRHHLHHSLLRDALVVVNEAAHAPVDDALLVGSTRLRVLAGGCACCETRPALVALLRDICNDRVGGDASARRTDHIVLETSGLADPGRIADSIVTDPVLQHHIVVGEIIVTVDALHGLGQIRDEDLGRRQIETADRLVVTKVDATEVQRLRRLIATLRVLNPSAALSGSIMGSPTDLPDACGCDPETLPVADADGTTAEIQAASLDLGGTPDWPALAVWLSALIHARGDDILRVKGIVRTPRGPPPPSERPQGRPISGDTARRTRGRRQSGWLAYVDRAPVHNWRIGSIVKGVWRRRRNADQSRQLSIGPLRVAPPPSATICPKPASDGAPKSAMISWKRELSLFAGRLRSEV